MPKKIGIAIVAVGAVLILSALLLFFYNCQEDAKAGQEAESLLENVESVIEMNKRKAADTGKQPGDDPSAASDSQISGAMLDGYEYAGYIEIPVLGLKLPVMSEWDYNRLKLAPCRQFGSSRTDDLVIAGHNYKRHFGYLKNLSAGDTVTFTDMDGILNTYRVAKIETLDPNQVDAVQNSGYALVLYTCTMSGKTRTTVFCSREEAAATSPAPAPMENEAEPGK